MKPRSILSLVLVLLALVISSGCVIVQRPSAEPEHPWWGAH